MTLILIFLIAYKLKMDFAFWILFVMACIWELAKLAAANRKNKQK